MNAVENAHRAFDGVFVSCRQPRDAIEGADEHNAQLVNESEAPRTGKAMTYARREERAAHRSETRRRRTRSVSADFGGGGCDP